MDNPLDGNGDGIGGDAYVRTFTVDLPDGYVYEGRSNDSIATATALALTEDPGGSGYFSARGLGAIDPAGEDDYWSFEAQAGDRVAIWQDTPVSGLDTEVYIYNASGTVLTSDRDSGPGQDSYISGYVIPSDGTYYVRARSDYSDGSGMYEVRVDLVRGAEMETDAEYNNDGSADGVSLTQDGNHRLGKIAGTVRDTGDEDTYSLGLLNPGNVIELDITIPENGTLTPVIAVFGPAGAVLSDTDGDLFDGHFQATVETAGTYCVRLSSIPAGTVEQDGHFYTTSYSTSWTGAEAFAQALGGHLVTVNDSAEQSWIVSQYGYNRWIGFNDIAEEGTWVWSSGDPVDYTHWYSGYPNGSGDGAYIYRYGNNGWMDSDGSFSGIVELETDLPDLGTAGSWARYVMDVDISDPIPPQITSVTRLPEEGETTEEMLATFDVSFSEVMNSSTVNTPLYNWQTYNGHTYVYVTSTKTWQAAESYAQSLGGHLATVNDAEEQAWLYSEYGSTASFWIGMNDYTEEGTWIWSSGEDVTYTNWAGNEPNSGSDYDGGYVYSGNGQWYDYRNSKALLSVIEFGNDADTDGDGTPDVVDSHPADPLNGWDLREAGIDGVFDTADDDVYDLRVTSYSGTGAALRIYDGPMHDGTYRLTVNPSLTDVVDNPLDGNGDGIGGDAYVRTFTVDLPDGYVYEGRSNDSIATATALALTEDPGGSGYFSARGLGAIDPAGEDDYWSFEAQAGDRVAIWQDTPVSGLDTEVYIYNASGTVLTSDRDSGPGQDSYISGYVIPSDGTYYVRARSDYSDGSGMYEVRVDLVRGAEMETDAEYNNDGSADGVSLTQDGNHRLGKIAGTVRDTGDEDTYSLGLLNPGNVIELDITIPENGTLTPVIAVFGPAGAVLSDTDGDLFDGHFQATVETAGTYCVRLSSIPAGTVEQDGHFYTTSYSTSWTGAEAFAQALGGHLVTVNDSAEQSWIVSQYGYNRWIGFNDIAEEGTWVWSSGDPVDYTHWYSGYPNGSGDGAYIYRYGNNGWMDSDGSFSGIVELETDLPDLGTAGSWARYVMDVDISDPIPPQITSVTRLPEEGETTEEMLATFDVSFSEVMNSSTVNTPLYNWQTYNGHTYVYVTSTKTWQAAESYAQSLGGHLATVNDAEEQAWLYSEYGSTASFWIGMNDYTEEGTWIWSSGEDVTYTNWAGNEPNSGSDYDGGYVYSGNGQWYDYRNSKALLSVIEFGNDADTDGDGTPDVVDSHPADPLNGWDLREAGIDGVFDTADDDVYDLRVTSYSGTGAALRIYDGPMHDGTYRLTVNPSLTERCGQPS